MNTLTDELKEKAKKLNKTIILPETEDERVLRATEKIINEGIAKIALVGDEKKIKEEQKLIQYLARQGFSLDKIFKKLKEYKGNYE